MIVTNPVWLGLGLLSLSLSKTCQEAIYLLQGSEVSENEEMKNGPADGLVVIPFGSDRYET